MSGGLDRYFQFARCFRDENLRSDRQPEFTQVDIEMSFAGPEQLFDIVERIVRRVWLDVKASLTPNNWKRNNIQDRASNYPKSFQR